MVPYQRALTRPWSLLSRKDRGLQLSTETSLSFRERGDRNAVGEARLGGRTHLGVKAAGDAVEAVRGLLEHPLEHALGAVAVGEDVIAS